MALEARNSIKTLQRTLPPLNESGLIGARISKSLVSFLSPSVAIPEGDRNASSNVWEKFINPDETHHVS